MQRFHKSEKDKWGRVVIYDIENTEPICIVYASYHPYAPDLILEALNKAFPKVRPDVMEILGIKDNEEI